MNTPELNHTGSLTFPKAFEVIKLKKDDYATNRRHDLAHGRKTDPIVSDILNAPIGTAKVYAWHSRRIVAVRIPQGAYVTQGQAYHETRVSVDCIAVIYGDTVLKSTPHDTCTSSIEREYRDACPAKDCWNELVDMVNRNLWGNWLAVMHSAERRGGIGSLLSWLETCAGIPSKWSIQGSESTLKTTFLDYCKGLMRHVGLDPKLRSVIRLQSNQHTVPNGRDTIESFDNGVFKTSQGVRMSLDYDLAKARVLSRESFSTTWGQFHWIGDTAICGCHRFNGVKLREFFGLQSKLPDERGPDEIAISKCWGALERYKRLPQGFNIYNDLQCERTRLANYEEITDVVTKWRESLPESERPYTDEMFTRYIDAHPEGIIYKVITERAKARNDAWQEFVDTVRTEALPLWARHEMTHGDAVMLSLDDESLSPAGAFKIVSKTFDEVECEALKTQKVNSLISARREGSSERNAFAAMKERAQSEIDLAHQAQLSGGVITGAIASIKAMAIRDYDDKLINQEAK